MLRAALVLAAIARSLPAQPRGRLAPGWTAGTAITTRQPFLTDEIIVR